MWIGRERGGAVAAEGQGGSAERRELAQRMKAIADEEGLERVEEEAVEHVQAALHAHLLRLLRAAAPSAGGGGGGGGETRGAKREREEPPLLTRGSLRVAVARDGKGLLRDDLPLQREKLLLLE